MVTSVNDSTDHCTSRTAAVEVVEEEPSLQPHPNRKRKNTASPINLTTTTATESVATKRVVHAFTVALPASSTSTAAEPPECNGCGGVAPPPTSTLPTEEDTGVAATLPEKVRKKKRLKAKTHRTETAEGGTSHPHQSRGGNRTSGHSTTGRWTADEHRLFLQGLAVHGREWKRVAANIATRTSAQVRSHAQKYFAKLEKSSYHNRALADDDDQHSEENERGWRQLNHHQDSSEDMEMSDSVRREAARILANPETVESEVRETLERLSERYRHLRERLLLQQPQLLQHQQPGGLAAVAVQEDDELIALHVLQGGLQHQQQQQPPRPNSPLAVAVAVESDTEKAVDDEAQTPCATTTTMLGSKKNVDRMQ